MLLINEISNLINCEISELENLLSVPFYREKIIQKFKGVWLKTTYKNRTGFQHEFQFDGLTIQGARSIRAYNNFLGVTVMQHLYIRHRIITKNSDLPCVIETTANGETRYYPMEFLEIINNNPEVRTPTTLQENIIYNINGKSIRLLINKNNSLTIYF